MSEETIIDGVNVSECTYSKIGIDEKCYCEEDLYDDGTPVFTCDECSDCYFKQLKRLQEENEKLNKKLQYSTTWEYLNKASKYKQTLEKIRDILCNGRTFYEGYFDNPNLSRTDKAVKVINEVLNETK